MIGFGQLTMIPDANFEQALINLGYDNGAINGSVYTSMIDTVTNLNIEQLSISDLTGIEDFVSIEYLDCSFNWLTILDVSNNIALTHLNCGWNSIGTLDLTNNPALTWLNCVNTGISYLDLSNNTALDTLDISSALVGNGYSPNTLSSLDVSSHPNLSFLNCESNQLTSLILGNKPSLVQLLCGFRWQPVSPSGNLLTSLDLSNTPALTDLKCDYNQLTTLDLTNNPALTDLKCWNNQFTSLDLRNGNNTILTWLECYDNSTLTCIDVDDVVWSTANWTTNGIDPQHYFSNNCSGTAIEEHSTNKKLLRTIDILGRETKNNPIFYIYDDGTVEKRITIE